MEAVLEIRFKALHLIQAVLQACCVPLHACMQSHSSHVQLFVTPWTVARQAPLSMGFSRQEYWSGVPRPPPGDPPNPGIEPTSLESPLLTGGFFTTSATWDPAGCAANPLCAPPPVSKMSI